MKVKDFFGKNIDVNCYVSLYLGVHDDGGELLNKEYGNENSYFEPWYEMEVVYVTVDNKGGIILEVA